MIREDGERRRPGATTPRGTRAWIEEVCRATGVEPSIICTPMELLEE
jgi:hypothetical protein